MSLFAKFELGTLAKANEFLRCTSGALLTSRAFPKNFERVGQRKPPSTTCLKRRLRAQMFPFCAKKSFSVGAPHEAVR